MRRDGSWSGLVARGVCATAAAAVVLCGLFGAGFPANAIPANDFPTKEVPPDEWVKSLCSSFLQWTEDLAAARDNPDLVAEKPKTRKAALIDVLEAQTEATTQLLKRSKKSGTPDVDDGKAIAKTFRKGYERARDTFAAAAEDAQDVRTRNIEVYEEDALALQEQIVEGATAIGETFDAAGERYDATAVDEAFQAEPTCTGVTQ